MKPVVFIVVSLALIIGFGLLYTSMVERQCKDMINRLEEVYGMIQNNNWETASSELRQADIKWQDIRKIWHAFTDHTNIDDIDESFVRLKALAKAQKAEDCLIEIAVLRNKLINVPARERLTLSNIF